MMSKHCPGCGAQILPEQVNALLRLATCKRCREVLSLPLLDKSLMARSANARPPGFEVTYPETPSVQAFRDAASPARPVVVRWSKRSAGGSINETFALIFMLFWCVCVGLGLLGALLERDWPQALLLSCFVAVGGHRGFARRPLA